MEISKKVVVASCLSIIAISQINADVLHQKVPQAKNMMRGVVDESMGNKLMVNDVEISERSQDVTSNTKEVISLQQQNKKAYQWGIGFGAIFSPNPYKDTNYTILPIPVISYLGEDLTIYGPYVSYKLYKSDFTVTEAQLFLYPEQFKAKDSNDSQMQRLDNRNYIVMAGFKQRFISAYGDINVGLNFDITGQSNGYMGVIEYEKRFVFIKGQHLFSLKPSIGLQYSSKQLTDYYYGISYDESVRSGLAQYTPSDEVSPYLGLAIVYSYGRRWNLSLTSRVNRLSDSVSDSPMISNQYVLTSSIALSYSF
ncbi:MipA/OmpV family protein [Cysteiniphilum sp. QT6929]|uniref:MipA/OmpV family protein n=1 Tax=Cysteiniphilum sp. QT6929 TaxID=2975055 RepID=UPI0024B34798|nr:MipA/OmpV family protein [Cysteiniphilum sp. QT6929]WHN66259.1 MipA/OmpV family protein [Cysteiniphilum sp. QT6929]